MTVLQSFLLSARAQWQCWRRESPNLLGNISVSVLILMLWLCCSSLKAKILRTKPKRTPYVEQLLAAPCSAPRDAAEVMNSSTARGDFISYFTFTKKTFLVFVLFTVIHQWWLPDGCAGWLVLVYRCAKCPAALKPRGAHSSVP